MTTTAELADAFRTQARGRRLRARRGRGRRCPGRLLVLTTAGELVTLAEARARPLEIAAANWVASAMAVGARHADALMLDVGGTTADVIPIVGGRVASGGRTDLDRLLAGELVYTGVLRTNLAAIAPRVPVRGRLCPVASELFAISADVHLILGHLPPGAYGGSTPDGRPASLECARERVARLVCADMEQLEPGEVDAIAAFLHAEQVRQVEEAARRVSARFRARRRSCRWARGRSSPARWRSASASRCWSCRGARPSATPRPPRRSPSWRRHGCAGRDDARPARRGAPVLTVRRWSAAATLARPVAPCLTVVELDGLAAARPDAPC